MPYISRITVKDAGGDFDFSSLSREAYRIGTQDEAKSVAYDASAMIQDFREVVDNYCQKFDQDFNEYIHDNSLVRKMKNVLNPEEGQRGNAIYVSNKELTRNRRATEQFASTMLLGHSLLNQMRETLTGQVIRTKFMIEYDGEYYEVYEDEIQDYVKIAIDRYRGQSTVSNPFSLAYQLDAEVLKNAGILKEENKMDDMQSVDLFQQIWDLKPAYLEYKSSITHKQYPNIFFDAKDSEIVELLQQEALEYGYMSIGLARYIQLRKSMGGGGGYASAFYKIGDIGSTQVKFFKFKKQSGVVNVNFARFSLLRDRFRELRDILGQSSENDIMKGLEEFFTEKESNVSDRMSTIFNRKAKESIAQWLTMT